MIVTVQNLTSSPLSCDVGLLLPTESKSVAMGPAEAYRAAAGLKTLSDSGKVLVTIAEEPLKLDNLEPAAVGTAAAADGTITTAKLGDLAVTTAKLDNLSVTAGKLATGAVTAGKIAAGGVSAATQFAAGVVNTAALGAAAVTAAKVNMFVSTEQTGTGAAQNVAHGLTGTPSVVMVTVTDSATGVFTVVEGVHDGTNVKLTVTTGVKFKVLAWI